MDDISWYNLELIILLLSYHYYEKINLKHFCQVC